MNNNKSVKTGVIIWLLWQVQQPAKKCCIQPKNIIYKMLKNQKHISLGLESKV